MVSGRPGRGALRPLSPALLLAIALGGSASGQLAESGVPPPRPISPAERAAVQLALDYFSRGSEAWVAALSSDSWLKSLSPADAKAEIEARAGPVDGADWVLATAGSDLKDRLAVFVVEYPSGLETRLFLDLAKEGSAWRLRDLRTWSQRQPVTAPSPASPPPRSLPGRIGSLALLAVGVAIAVVALVVSQRRDRGRLLAAAGAAVVAGLALGWFFFLRTCRRRSRARRCPGSGWAGA